MESSSLFNPGFLGGSFYWFIGQVADDSTWRKNQNPEKFEVNFRGLASIEGKKRDELQEVISLIKDMKLDYPVNFTNFKD